MPNGAGDVTLKGMKWILPLALLTACASAPQEPQGKYHSANSVNDLFEVEQGMPVREVRPQQFFPKKCELATRHPQFSKTEFECSEN